jgi:type IV fimbrial biogenesis protein FimT
MVTLAIAAIVLSIGVPSFQAYIQNSRQTTDINELATALQLARNTAISRKVRVTICKSNDGANCRTGGGSGDWKQGWMLFTNPNNITGTAGLTAAEELLRVHGALGGDGSFIGNNNVVNRVSFNAKGLALGSNGTITRCDSRGNTSAKALVISLGGQVRQAVDDSGNGIVDVDGTGATDVTC